MIKKVSPAVSAPHAQWLSTAATAMRSFAKNHKITLEKKQRQLSASFEIGCLHALLNLYQNQKYVVTPANLITDPKAPVGTSPYYRYLTTPSGNPSNFSYVELVGPDGDFEVRQQVRIESHVDPDIRFTPDIVVLVKNAPIAGVKNASFANGKRAFFSVKSDAVVAAHECKSTYPFPELMVSFIGMLVTAHKWHPSGVGIVSVTNHGHLAPTLFVGGTARALHLKMIQAMQTAYKLNIVVGMHGGTWSLKQAQNRLLWAPPSLPTLISASPAASGVSAGPVAKKSSSSGLRGRKAST